VQLHANARLTPALRRLLVHRVRELGWRVTEPAPAAQSHPDAIARAIPQARAPRYCGDATIDSSSETKFSLNSARAIFH